MLQEHHMLMRVGGISMGSGDMHKHRPKCPTDLVPELA